MRRAELSIRGGLIVLIWLSITGIASAQDGFIDFTKAKNAFDSGMYDHAVSRFEEILDGDITNPALLVEIHKYLAVSYLFVGNKNEAEKQFLLLLNQEPDFQLDPLVFPIDVVDFFTEVQRKHARRLEEITKAKAKARQAREKREAQKRKEALAKLRRYVYLEKEVIVKSRIITMMPFGAGQFQNGHSKKGILFLIGQSALFTSSFITYALHQRLRDYAREPFLYQDDRKDYEKRERLYRTINTFSVIGLGTLFFVGIVDAIYFYEPREVRWRRIDETHVPMQLRPARRRQPKPTLSLDIGNQSAGIRAVIRF